MTQSLGVAAQLEAGIRYFDLRLVAVRGGAGEWRVLHCLTGARVTQLLTELAAWTELHPGEVSSSKAR